MKLPFQRNDLILFTGDSITDAGRVREDPQSLGAGYPHMLAGRLGYEAAELNLTFRNTGISGDRTCDLLQRWKVDCTALQPDWVSILVGVNNTWRRYDQNDPTSAETFESEYRELLSRIKENTAAGIILCSPFLLHTEPFVEKMREDLNPQIATIKKLAVEFNTIWVDFDAAFNDAQYRQPPVYWAADGVHPSIAGHALMAGFWLDSVTG